MDMNERIEIAFNYEWKRYLAANVQWPPELTGDYCNACMKYERGESSAEQFDGLLDGLLMRLYLHDEQYGGVVLAPVIKMEHIAKELFPDPGASTN